MDLITQIGTSLSSVLSWIGNVVDAVVTTDGALNSLVGLFCVGIAISGVMLGIKVLRSFTWGN